MKKDNKQRLFEMMSKVDTSFKNKLNENIGGEEFIPHGSYTVSNSGGYEIMLNDTGDAAKVRDAYGSDNPQTSDWLEIEYVPDEDTGELEPVIDPNGYNIPLNQVMKINKQSGLGENVSENTLSEDNLSEVTDGYGDEDEDFNISTGGINQYILNLEKNHGPLDFYETLVEVIDYSRSHSVSSESIVKAIIINLIEKTKNFNINDYY